MFGAAVAQVIMRNRALYVKERPESQNNFFEFRAVEAHTLVLFKYSTRTKPPWHFNISESQLQLLEDCDAAVAKPLRFAALICHLDGICLLDLPQLATLIGNRSVQNGISVWRPPRGSYRVRGPGRVALENPVPRSRWTAAIVGK